MPKSQAAGLTRRQMLEVGGSAPIDVRAILKIVRAVPRRQILGDTTVAVDRGRSTVYQVAATNPDIKAAVAKKFGGLLKQTNPSSEIVIYPGVGHGFFAKTLTA